MRMPTMTESVCTKDAEKVLDINGQNYYLLKQVKRSFGELLPYTVGYYAKGEGGRKPRKKVIFDELDTWESPLLKSEKIVMA